MIDRYRLSLIASAAFALAACDSAGTVLDDSARLAAVEQCKQVSESAGIAAGAVNSVCTCAADKWLEKPVAERIKLDTASIQGIIAECAGSDRTQSTATPTLTPTDTATPGANPSETATATTPAPSETY